MFRLYAHLTLLTFAFGTGTAMAANPFRDPSSFLTTFAQDAIHSEFIVYGRIENAKRNEAKDGGTAEFVIQKVLKNHTSLKGKTRIVLDRYVEPTSSSGGFVLFGINRNDKFDGLRGIAARTEPKAVVVYVEGMLKKLDRPQSERLRYAFDFIEHNNVDVAKDALHELALADSTELRAVGKILPADKVAAVLRDATNKKMELYGMLLGYSGREEHVPLLQSLSESQADPGGLKGVLIGIMLLKPRESERVTKMLLNRDAEFVTRYNALCAFRYMHTYENKVPKGVIEDAILKMMADVNLADFGADDLRKWKRWDLTPQVLNWFDVNSHQSPVIRRSIMKFALQSPTDEGRAFVAAQRRRDAEWVADIEELLKLEQ